MKNLILILLLIVTVFPSYAQKRRAIKKSVIEKAAATVTAPALVPNVTLELSYNYGSAGEIRAGAGIQVLLARRPFEEMRGLDLDGIAAWTKANAVGMYVTDDYGMVGLILPPGQYYYSATARTLNNKDWLFSGNINVKEKNDLFLVKGFDVTFMRK